MATEDEFARGAEDKSSSKASKKGANKKHDRGAPDVPKSKKQEKEHALAVVDADAVEITPIEHVKPKKKAPSKAAREDQIMCFTLSLTRPVGCGKPLGVDLDTLDASAPRVTAVLETGVIPSWNEACPAEQHQLKAGDHIIAVNGAHDTTSILQHLTQDETLDIVVQRLLEFKVRVTKCAVSKCTTSLGIDFFFSSCGTSLLLRDVLSDGAFSDWNASHKTAVVKAGDRIVEVNGTRGCCNELISQMQISDDLDIVISPSPDYNRFCPPSRRDSHSKKDAGPGTNALEAPSSPSGARKPSSSPGPLNRTKKKKPEKESVLGADKLIPRAMPGVCAEVEPNEEVYVTAHSLARDEDARDHSPTPVDKTKIRDSTVKSGKNKKAAKNEGSVEVTDQRNDSPPPGDKTKIGDGASKPGKKKPSAKHEGADGGLSGNIVAGAKLTVLGTTVMRAQERLDSEEVKKLHRDERCTVLAIGVENERRVHIKLVTGEEGWISYATSGGKLLVAIMAWAEARSSCSEDVVDGAA